MEIYRYKIWTGNIPGVYTEPCEDKKLVGVRRNAPKPPDNPSDCDACSGLGNATTVIDACLDCWTGMINPCCPDNNTNCCGLIIDDCEKLHAMEVEDQNEYCAKCYNNRKNLKEWETNFISKAASKAITPIFTDPRNLCKCCNRTKKNSQDSMLSIFLDQDFNDIGHYSMWDGEMEQDDTFSNFTVVGDTTNPYMVSLKNSTEFRFFKFLENIQYTIDWGDPAMPPTTVTAPLDTVIATYPNPGTFIINVRMSAPWGVSSVSHRVTVPFQTGAQLWSNYISAGGLTGQTYTFIPPGFSTPVSMDYEFSDWGPLDSGLDIHGYMTSNYGSTPYPINGVTQSMISALQSYNTTSTPGLPPGYVQGNTVVVAGQVLMPDGSYVDNLTGQIDSFNSVMTAYTITNGTEVFQMMDHINGETVFSTVGYGMSADDFLTRKCGFSLQGACDICNVDQIYFDGNSYITQPVNNDRGEWDVLEDYEPKDYVYYDGCCFFALTNILANNSPPNILDANSVFWRVCHGSCFIEDSLPSRYMCVDGTCILISPSSSYYNTATFIGSPPSTSNALSDCINYPCVPTGGQVMHYECEDGACVQVTPGATIPYNYGTCTYQGPTALTDCQADVSALLCTNTSGGIKYDCIYNSTSNTSSCFPASGGFYPDLTSCQNTCGGSGSVYDWYCTEEITSGPDGTLGNSDDVLINVCRGVAAGDPVPANAVTGIPYSTYADCQTTCISNNDLWFCMCNATFEGVQVPLTPGQFGGQYCVNWPNAPSGTAGGFGTQIDCEQNCLSWDCDDNTGVCTQKDATNTSPGQHCSEFLGFFGTEILTGGPTNAIPITACDVVCTLPSTHICLTGGLGNFGNCTEVDVNDTTYVNPNHAALGGTGIDWVTANNWLGIACNEIDEITCNSPLSQQCGQGCGPCDANPSTDAPFVAYSATTPYMFYDTVISYQFNGSTQNSEYKYFYDPSPVCDDGLGMQIGTSAPWIGIFLCNPNTTDMDTCEDPIANSAQNHPCMNQVGMVCNNPPLQNVPPPVDIAKSRLDSGTCWAPCVI